MSLIVLIQPGRQNIELMPLKNGSSDASFRSILELQHTSKGPRPFKFKVLDGTNEDLRPPAEAVDLLRMADMILIPKHGDEVHEKDVINLLQGYQLDYEWVDVCRFCLSEGRFQPVDSKSVKFRGDLICENCAMSELHREIHSGTKRMAEEGIERLFQLLLKTKDLDRMLVFLDPKKMDRELTVFDRVTSGMSVDPVNVNGLDLDDRLKKLLPEKLLPVQSLSIRSGLLKKQNQLVVSATATGKTLIGEMAGVNNILEGKGKMLFLVPLVALANQKHDQFTKKYGSIGITTSIKVGQARIKMGKRFKMRTSLDSDIIVGTYEGIDHLLRTGTDYKLGNVGTVVMDEVHMIEDPERGPRLDGLIARLRYLYPKCQFIYLSATVGNPGWLAKGLGSTLIEYEERPVPLERHLLFGGASEKLRLINQLAQEEYNKSSSKGFKGQTIVFAHSRRSCHKLSDALRIPSAPYHAGLPYKQRRKTEEEFAKGNIPVVVTTAALAAGVDFPASQVIFESLVMGNDWITQGEFFQMQGRAGRPDYHDVGVVVVMAEPDKRLGQGESEEQVAFRLLRGEMGPISLQEDEDSGLEQVLVSAAIFDNIQKLKTVESLRLGGGNVDHMLKKLHDTGYLDISNQKIHPTKLGRIMTEHFLNHEQVSIMKEGIISGVEPEDIITNLEVFDRAFFVGADRIAATLNVRLPSRVFQGAAMEMALSGESLGKLDSNTKQKLMNFATDLLTCTCKDTPYCGCPERKFSKRLLQMRCDGASPAEIIETMTARYDVFAYLGDVIEYLETAARNLEAIVKIAEVTNDQHKKKQAKVLLKCIVG